MKYKYILNINESTNFEAKSIINIFYVWLIEKINNDYEKVKEEEYEYLISPFEKSKSNILIYCKKYKNNSMYMDKNETVELSNYLEHTKKKYERLCNIQEYKKSIQHYNRLLSWYTKTPKNIDCLINVLIQASLKKEMDNETYLEYSNMFVIKSNTHKKKTKFKTDISFERSDINEIP